MLSILTTVTVSGLDTDIVHVETDTKPGLPSFTIVGLPDLTVRESKERIHSAILNSGYGFPSKRITINLAPADTRKLGSHFDLPLATGVFASGENVGSDILSDTAFLGELSLGGKVNKVENCLALIIGLKQSGIAKIFLPRENIREASVINGLTVYPVTSFSDIADHLTGFKLIDPVHTSSTPKEQNLSALTSGAPDFIDVLGQERAKRAFQISAAGRHDLSLVGPPGSGKTMLARRMSSILPSLSYDEMLEVTKIYSIAGESISGGIAIERPFRAPHHSATAQALVGGGSRPRPGEVSLAHMGVLFLDELPEFSRHAIDTLRQPLEDGFVTISRAASKLKYRCDIILITAMNPCPCGYYGHPTRECTCGETQRRRYLAKVSGPLRDRIDMCLDIGPVEYESLSRPDVAGGKSSADLRRDVLRVYDIQKERYRNDEIKFNAKISTQMLNKYCGLDRESEQLLKAAFNKYGFSARAGNKIKKVARTIADIEASENICAEHIAEAISYRMSKV